MQNPSEGPTPDLANAETSVSRPSRPRRLPLNNLQIILIALIIVGGRLVIDFSQRIVEGQQKIAEQHALEAEIETLLEERQHLEASKAYYGSPTYIETWAHDNGKMVREGEKLVIPLYDTPAQEANPAQVPTQTTTPLPAWQVWWTMFFDAPPPFINTADS